MPWKESEREDFCVGGTVQEELLGFDGSLIAKLATDPIQERSPSFFFPSIPPRRVVFLFLSMGDKPLFVR